MSPISPTLTCSKAVGGESRFDDALEGVRAKTDIDWIKIRVTLSSPSQFRHVQERLLKRFGKTYVTPCEREASSLSFEFPVQDPAGADQLMLDLQDLTRPGDPPIRECDVEIIGIEIALDGYIKGSDRSRLAAATGHFVRHLWRLPAGTMRATSKKHFRFPESLRDLLQLLEGEVSINMGGRNDNFRVRAYRKYYDTIAGKRVNLPLDEHRARIEVTLAGEHLPFTTINSWRNFRFEDLSKPRFAMCKPVATGLGKLVQERKVQFGRTTDAFKIRPSDRRERSAFTRADSATNEKVRKALISLTKRQSCRNSEKKWADFMAASEKNSNFCSVVLNTPQGYRLNPTPASSPQQQSTLTGSSDSCMNAETDSFLAKLVTPANEDDFDTALPEEWGIW